MRQATIQRDTLETQITVNINLDGTGQADLATRLIGDEAAILPWGMLLSLGGAIILLAIVNLVRRGSVR